MAVLLQQIPSYQLGGATSAVRNQYASIKSRIDQSDPNPAHKLQHTVEDLTVDSEQGRKINPRFSISKFGPNPSSLIQRRRTTDFNDRFPLSTCHKKSSFADYRLQKSESVDSHFSRRQPIKVDCAFPVVGGGIRRQRLSKMSSLDESRQFPQSNHRSPLNSTFETIDEDDAGLAATADSTARRVPKPQAFSATLEEEEEEMETVQEKSRIPKLADTETDSNDGVGVAGMEITSSETETTVVLQHILALAASRNNNSSSSNGNPGKRVTPPTSPSHHLSMAIIEEDEEDEDEFFESHDAPLTPLSPEAHPYTLAHPIPRLAVLDEDGELVETVVEKTTEFTGRIVSAAPATSAAQSFILNPTIEEEEELQSCFLSTRL